MRAVVMLLVMSITLAGCGSDGLEWYRDSAIRKWYMEQYQLCNARSGKEYFREITQLRNYTFTCYNRDGKELFSSEYKN